MTPAEATAMVTELLTELGFASTLSSSNSIQQDDGGVQMLVVSSNILIAPDTDQELFQDSASKRVIEAYMSGATPRIGDTITFADGLEHRVDAVDTFYAGRTAVAWKVMLS